MANLPETPQFVPVPGFEGGANGTQALGGDESAPANLGLAALTARTAWLKDGLGVKGVWDMTGPLPAGAADGRWFQVGTAGTFGGKAAQAGDFVMLYANMTRIVVIPANGGGLTEEAVNSLIQSALAPVQEQLDVAERHADGGLATGRNALLAANYVLSQLHVAVRTGLTLFILDRDMPTPPPLAVAADFSFYVVLREHFEGWGVPESQWGSGPLLAWYGPDPHAWHTPLLQDETDGSYDLNDLVPVGWHFFPPGIGMQLYVQDEQAWYEVVPSGLSYALQALTVVKLRGEWDMTGTTVIPYADPARDVGLETIDPQSTSEIARFRIVAGGVPVYNGMAFMHHQSSDQVATNTGDVREAWTELADFGADNSAINVLLAVFADETMSAQDLIDAFFQNPATAEREFYYFAWMWSPARTQFSLATRSGAARTATGDSLGVPPLPVGTPLALRMDWATSRPSIFRQDNSTDLLTATNSQLQAPAGMRFRPWTFVMTMGADDIASMQAVPLQYNLGNSLASGFVGVGDAVLPDRAKAGDAFRVTAPGQYQGVGAEAGDTAVLRSGVPALQVFKGSRGVTRHELQSLGYMTEPEVTAAVPPDPAVTYALARREFVEQPPVTNIDGEDPASRPFGEVRVVGVNPTGVVLGNCWPGDLVITGAKAFHRYQPLPAERWYLPTLFDQKPVEMIYVGRGKYSGASDAAIVLDNASWGGYVSMYPHWRSRVAVPLATDVEVVFKAVAAAPDGKFRVSVLTDLTRLLTIADSSPEVEILFVTDPESVVMGGTAQGTITVVSQAGYYKRFTVSGGNIASAISLSPGVEQGNGIWIKPGESLVIRWYMALAGGNTAINFAVDRWNNLQGGVADATFTPATMSVDINTPVSVVRLAPAPGLTNRQLNLNSFSPSQDQELTILAEEDIAIRLASNGGYDFEWPANAVMKRGRAYRFKYERAGSRWILVSDRDPGAAFAAGLYTFTGSPTVSGAPVDDSDRLLAFLDNGGQPLKGRVVVQPANGTDRVYLAKPVSIYGNDVVLDCTQADLLLGAGGKLRTSGGLDEYSRKPDGGKLALASAATVDADGRLVLPLRAGEGQYLQVNDKLLVRGQNDATGRSLEKQTTYVLSVAGDTVTCTDEPLFDFQASYPSSDYAPDHTVGTTITVVRQSLAVADIAAGAVSVTVADGSLFAVGNTVLVSDTQTETDIATAQTPGLSYDRLYRNAASMEFAQLIRVDGNTLLFDRPLMRRYLASAHAGVAKVLPVTNSHLLLRNVYFSEPQTSKTKVLELSYSRRCSIALGGAIHGEGYRRGDGLRFNYALDCVIRGGHVDGAGAYGSGEGYGVTWYYATDCVVERTEANGCRHNFLMQASTNCRARDIVSRDDVVSGFDIHGANTVGGEVDGITLSRSDTSAAANAKRTLAGVTTSGGIRVGNTSHVAGDKRLTFRHVQVNGYKGGAAVDFTPASAHLLFEDVHVQDADIPFRLYKNASGLTPTQTLSDVTLKGWVVERCGAPDVLAASTGQISGLQVIDYTEKECAAHLSLGATAAGLFEGLTIDGYRIVNPVAAPGGYGLEFSKIAGLRVRNSDVRLANRGLHLTDCPNADVQDNRLDGVLDGAQYEYVDGGGNAGAQVFRNGSGYWTKSAQLNGTLAAGYTTAAVLAHDNAAPSVANGASIVSGQYTSRAGRKLHIGATIPYLSLSAADTVTAHLFVDGDYLSSWSGKLNSGATSGMGISLPEKEFLVPTSNAMSIELRLGTAAGSTITLNAKFAGGSMPYVRLREEV